MREEPIQEYFPGALIRLIIRFEDYQHLLGQPKPDPVTGKTPPLPQQIKGASKNQFLSVVKTATGYDIVSKNNTGSVANGTTSPQTAISSSDGFTHEIGGIIPRSATYKMEGIKQGGKLTVELKYSDFPIDPRAIRACAIEFYMGTVTRENFEAGMNGQTRIGTETDNSGGLSLSVIPYTYVDNNNQQRTNLRFKGWVDDFEADFNADDEPIIRLECSDNTRLLFNQLAPAGSSIPPNMPIDQAIATYIAQFPQCNGLSVEYRPPGATIPMINILDRAKTAYRPQLGPIPSKNGESKLTILDYIIDECGSLGHVAFMDGTTIVIQQPQTLYSDFYPTRVDDPYIPRQLPNNGRLLKNRTMIYGRTIKSMNIRRKYTVSAPRNIEVRSYLGSGKQLLVARYPEKGDRLIRMAPGNNATHEDWLVKKVRGIQNQDLLKKIAHAIYEQQNRNEIEVKISTTRLSSFGGDNNDIDLMDLKVGDPLDIEINKDPMSSVSNSKAELENDAVNYMIKHGYNSKFAKAYAAAINNTYFQHTFVVKELEYNWSNEDGVSIDINLMNYIEVRADKSAKDNDPPASPMKQKSVKVKVEDNS